MTLLGQRRPADESAVLDAEVLIREARRLRHRRWALSLVTAAVLVLGGLVAFGTSRHGGPGNSNLGSSTSGHPVGSTASSALLNWTSERLSIAIAQRINGKPVLFDVTREAIKSGSASPSMQILESESTAVNSDGERNTTNTGGGAHVFVDGIDYSQLASGKWEGSKDPGLGEELQSGVQLGDLERFRQAATGSVGVLGHSVIGGIMTTEYRASISLLRLYYLGQQSGPGLLGSLLEVVDPAPGLQLALPIEIWADANGNVIRASAQYSKRYPPIERDGTFTNGGTTTLAATYTVSNFNAPVHAVAPPTKDVTIRPLEPVTAIAGKVSVSGEPAQPGVLEVTMTVQRGSRPGLHLRPSLVLVPPSGNWYLPDGIVPGQFELTATFYADGELKAECSPRFVAVTSGLTTKEINLHCSSQ